MSAPPSELGLLRVLANLAWIDGVVSSQERTSLRGVMAEFALDEAQRSEIEGILETPRGVDDLESAVREFKEVAGGRTGATQLLARAEHFVEADGHRSKEELIALHRVREWMEDRAADAGPLTVRLRGLFGRGGIGSVVRDLMGKTTTASGSPLEEKTRARAVLFGALLYRVIYADRIVQAEEVARLRDLLAREFSFAAEEIDYVLRAIQQRAAEDVDRQRLCAEFNRITTAEERGGLLRALFLLAAADEVESAEEKEIRLIANFLWIEVQEYVAIRREILGR